MILAASDESAILRHCQAHDRSRVRCRQPPREAEFPDVPHPDPVARRGVQLLVVRAQGDVVDEGVPGWHRQTPGRALGLGLALVLFFGHHGFDALVAGSDVPYLHVGRGHAEEELVHVGVLDGDDVVRVSQEGLAF